ncbi:uncharacterized protein LOC132675959 isoform X2 [Panthera onca]
MRATAATKARARPRASDGATAVRQPRARRCAAGLGLRGLLRRASALRVRRLRGQGRPRPAAVSVLVSPDQGTAVVTAGSRRSRAFNSGWRCSSLYMKFSKGILAYPAIQDNLK